MDKGRRTELTKLKHIKRLRRLRLDLSKGYYCYKHQTKPCSCYICSSNSYKQNGTKKKEYKLIKQELEE